MMNISISKQVGLGEMHVAYVTVSDAGKVIAYVRGKRVETRIRKPKPDELIWTQLKRVAAMLDIETASTYDEF